MRRNFLLAVVILTVLLCGAIAACDPRPSAVTTLHLVAHQTSFNRVDNPPSGMSATDMSTIIDDLFDAADEERVGHDEIVCAAVDANDLQCTGTLFLTEGQLTFTMPYSLVTRSGQGAITGELGRTRQRAAPSGLLLGLASHPLYPTTR
jgi:hypothetical protein